jgi:DNA mismatch repair protein MutL
MEAKFEEDQIIFAFLRSAIKRGLGKHNVAPSLDFESELGISIENLPKGKIVAEPSISVNPEYNPFLSTQSEQKTANLNLGRSFGDFTKPIPKDIDDLYSRAPNEVSEPAQESSLNSIVDWKSDLKVDKIFQLDNRYIVTAKDEEIVIIDIKRAHQRILYEGYLSAGRGGGTEVAQRLLFPEPILISKADIDLLLGAADVLKLFGLDIAKSESGGLEVLAVPSGLAEKLQDCIDSVLEALQDGTWTDVEGRRERFAKVWAEAGALNKKVRLSKEEMVDIVKRLFECESPGIDPRGRSVYTNLTVENIETKFT